MERIILRVPWATVGESAGFVQDLSQPIMTGCPFGVGVGPCALGPAEPPPPPPPMASRQIAPSAPSVRCSALADFVPRSTRNVTEVCLGFWGVWCAICIFLLVAAVLLSL